MKDPMELIESRLEKHPGLWRIYMVLNFCKSQYADGTVKTDGPLFRLFSRIFYLQCSCCAACRGILAGLIAGFVLSEVIRCLM
jgi:hypothetical protein